VQNLFCEGLECKIYFAKVWSAKFILRRDGVQNLFCVEMECKIYFASALECKIYFASALECKIYFASALECKIYFAKAKIDNDLFLKMPSTRHAPTVAGLNVNGNDIAFPD